MSKFLMAFTCHDFLVIVMPFGHYGKPTTIILPSFCIYIFLSHTINGLPPTPESGLYRHLFSHNKFSWKISTDWEQKFT